MTYQLACQCAHVRAKLWLHYANDLASTRYSPLDQINAANFDKLELAWRFSTNALGPRLDADYQSTPLVVKGRIYVTAGFRRDVVCLDAGTGELLWMHTHDEGERIGRAAARAWVSAIGPTAPTSASSMSPAATPCFRWTPRPAFPIPISAPMARSTCG